MPDIDILIKAAYGAASASAVKAATQDVDNLGKQAKTSSGLLGTLTSSLGTALKVGAVAGGAAIVGLGAAVATAGVNFNNLKQQANIAFSTMLGSGEKAKVFLDDLQQFAAATPFEFPELLSASQRLLAMGFAAEDVKPTLTAVGDAVAALGGSGELVGRVTTALGQMQAKGKASAEEMGQLTEAGIPGWKFLAEAIGTDVAGAMEQVSKGAIDAKTVITAVTEGMNRDFGGMMEKQSQTFGGLLSTIKDTFTQVSGTVMAPLFDMLTDGLAGIVAWTSSPAFTAGVQKFADTLSSIVNIAKLLVTGDFEGGIFGLYEDDPMIGRLFDIREALIETANQVKGSFNTIYGTITTTMGWIKLAWSADWGEIRTTWETFSTEIQGQHAAFWTEWQLTFNTGSKQNVNDWEGFLGGLFSFMTGWWTLVVANWTLSLGLLRGEWQLWSGLFTGDWQKAWDGLKLSLESFTDIILNLIEFGFGPDLRDKFAGALNGVWDTLSSWWDTLSSWWDAGPGRLLGMIGGANLSVPSLAPGGGGGGFGSTSSVTNGPVTINQQFYGPADSIMMNSANQSLLAELRQRGG